MALKRLTTGEMAHLSEDWVNEKTAAHQAILATPELAGLLPRVEAGHRGLHDTLPKQVDPRLAKVQEKAAAFDLRHDEIVRGGYWFLTSLAWLAGAGDAADGFLRLRDFLFPAGLDTTQKSYREESGAADMLSTRLAQNAAIKKQVKDIPVLKHNLLHYLDELFRVAKALGAAEKERAQLATAAIGLSDPQKMIEARNKWIRSVNALLAVAEDAELPEDTYRTIFGALQLAEKAADKRKGTPVDEPTDTGDAPDDSDATDGPPKK